MRVGTIFSGGGGFDVGATTAGFTPIWGIEYDRKIADLYALNIGHDPFADLLSANLHDYDRVDLLHASPTCVNFSGAKENAKELELDRQLADKICEFIRVLQPQFFTLENVPKYLKSQSFDRICKCLYEYKYFVTWDILDAADFGAATNRIRLIVRASKEPLSLIFKTHARSPQNSLFGVRSTWASWWNAIGDLFDDLPDSRLTDNQLTFIDRHPKLDRYLIQRVGYRKNRGALIRSDNLPCWTLLASLGDDRHGGNRNHVINAVDGDRVKSLNARALARIQSFPDWYRLPAELGASKLYRAIGNSVAPKLAEAVCRSLI